MKKKLKLFTLIIPILIIEKTSTLPPFSIKLTMLCGACTITTGDKPSQTAPFTNLQDVIDRNHEEISKLLTENSDIYDPLPFSFCSGPAIFDLAKSNKNKGLVEIILNRPEFSIDRLIDNNKNNLFHIIAESGSSTILSALFSYCQKNNVNYQPLMNSINTNGQTPLSLAVFNCRTKALRLLLKREAQHDARYMPLLHVAASTNSRGETKRNKTVDLLCKSGYSPWKTNQIGKTAQELAMQCNYSSTVDCLKKNMLETIVTLGPLYTQNNSYFNCLPRELWQRTTELMLGSKISNAENAQSQAAAP